MAADTLVAQPPAASRWLDYDNQVLEVCCVAYGGLVLDRSAVVVYRRVRDDAKPYWRFMPLLEWEQYHFKRMQ